MDMLEKSITIEDLHREVSLLRAEIAEMKDVMDRTKDVIDKVAAEVKPTIDALMENKLLRMALGIGKV